MGEGSTRVEKGGGVLRLSSSAGGKMRYCYERSSNALLPHALLLNGANRVDNFKISSSDMTKKRATTIALAVARFMTPRCW